MVEVRLRQHRLGAAHMPQLRVGQRVEQNELPAGYEALLVPLQEDLRALRPVRHQHCNGGQQQQIVVAGNGAHGILGQCDQAVVIQA